MIKFYLITSLISLILGCITIIMEIVGFDFSFIFDEIDIDQEMYNNVDMNKTAYIPVLSSLIPLVHIFTALITLIMIIIVLQKYFKDKKGS